jgi:hypothetical protein
MKQVFGRRDGHFKFVGHEELRVCLKIAPVTKIGNQQRHVEASRPKIAAITKVCDQCRHVDGLCLKVAAITQH